MCSFNVNQQTLDAHSKYLVSLRIALFSPSRYGFWKNWIRSYNGNLTKQKETHAHWDKYYQSDARHTIVATLHAKLCTFSGIIGVFERHQSRIRVPSLSSNLTCSFEPQLRRGTVLPQRFALISQPASPNAQHALYRCKKWKCARDFGM